MKSKNAKSTTTRLFISFGVILALTVVTVFIIRRSWTDYVPLGFVVNEGVVSQPERLSKDHLDRLEIVLQRYRVAYRRLSVTRLQIRRALAWDRDLLANYSEKASTDQKLLKKSEPNQAHDRMRLARTVVREVIRFRSSPVASVS